MIKELFLSLTLLQGICYQNSHEGRCGFRVNGWTQRVNKVYNNSPAQQAGIQVGDRLIETRDLEGHRTTEYGEAGEEVVITVKRAAQELKFKMKRVPVEYIEK